MKKELISIGLTEGEASVYLALLKLGEGTNSPIARHSGLQSSSVYYILNSLIEKGFVSYISRGSRKVFRAINPETIPEILKEREKELKEQKNMIKKIIPRLKGIRSEIKDKTTAEVYEGVAGFRMIFREILQSLKKGESYRAFAIEEGFNQSKAVQDILGAHNREVKRRGLKLLLLINERMRASVEKVYGRAFLKRYQEIRYTESIIPVGITIYKDVVVTHIHDYSGVPKAIKVQNKNLAHMYIEYFDSLWGLAKV